MAHAPYVYFHAPITLAITLKDKSVQSNINKGYEVKANSDGSVGIYFDAPKVSKLSSAAGFISLLFVVAGVISGLFAAAFTDSAIVGWIVGVGIMVLAFKLGNKAAAPSRREIKIYPNDGIQYGDIQLSFADIQSVGHAILSNKHGSAGYVLANALGQEVRLSSDIDPTLAAGIAEEVRRISGIKLA